MYFILLHPLILKINEEGFTLTKNINSDSLNNVLKNKDKKTVTQYIQIIWFRL
jgi:hypothetical protein